MDGNRLDYQTFTVTVMLICMEDSVKTKAVSAVIVIYKHTQITFLNGMQASMFCHIFIDLLILSYCELRF